MDKIFIIDAFNYLFRSYYAIGPMTNDEGQSTSALFGFINSLKKLKKDFSFKYLVVVFDGPESKTSRRKVYAEYKMKRKKAPDDLYPQFTWAYEYCNFSGTPILSIENFEADDVMATVAVWAEKQNLEVFLCTSDKDLFQLVRKNIHIVLAHKNNMIVNEEKVKEIFGVNPEQMLDYLAICGDTSDNIPGIPGFGPKTAKDLLNTFKTLDEIIKNYEKIPGEKKKEILKNNQDKAYLSKELATLNLDVQIPKKKDFFLPKEPDIDQLKKLYQKMKFSKFLKELSVEEKKIAKKEEEKVEYATIYEEKDLKILINTLLKEKEISIDTETTSTSPLIAKIIGIGFSKKAKEAFYIPFNGKIDEEIILKYLKLLFKNSKIKFFGHNIKYDIHILKNYEIEIKKISFDTILASYLLYPHRRKHNLDILSLEFLNKVKISYKDLIVKEKKKIPLKDVDIEKVSYYCCEDVDCTFRLKCILEKNIEKEKLKKLLTDVEIPLIPVLVKMERHGIYLDEKKFKNLSKKLTKELNELEIEIFKIVGQKFNIGSPKQLSDILFKKLQLPIPARKKTEYATSFDVLEKIKDKHKVIRKILEYRTLSKFLSTYVNALPKQVNPKTERIHPTYNQSIAATGRLSCQDPNLQNIPVKSLEIRKGFIPQKENWSFIGADYSQIELRILAHFSEDPELIKAFKRNEDIHAHTASLVFKVPQKEVTPKMRKMAKAVNFGILYGQGAYGLSKHLDIPYKEAKNFIEKYFNKYKRVSYFIERCKKYTLETKIAKTLLGRKRPIFEIDNKNSIVRALAQRLAINTPLQGTAADIIKLAMIEIDKEIEKEKLKGFMILQIHDELVFETPDNEIVKFKKLIKNKMEKIIKLKVPLIVDIKVGKNWGEC